MLLDEREWYGFSDSFRKRIELLSRQFAEGRLRLITTAVYLAPHLWSPAGDPWHELFKVLGPQARVLANVNAVAHETSARLAVVDPDMVLKRESVAALLDWARSGRVVALPETPFYTEAAKHELKTLLQKAGERSSGGRARRAGIPHRTYDVGQGTVVFYDVPKGAGKSDLQRSWKLFVGALLENARVSMSCGFSDGRLSAIPLVRRAGDGKGLGLFVLNGTGRSVAADILFTAQVQISDLALSLSHSALSPRRGESARRFSLEVPAGGILPLEVEGLDRDDEERVEAAELADDTRTAVDQAAASELPGFDPAAELIWS